MRRNKWSVGQLEVLGVPKGAVTVVEVAENGQVLRCKCATGSIPNAAAGYAVGCILTDTTTGKFYTNQGSITSCTFNEVGAITSAELADSIDLGSSGAAGDLEIFPTTAAKGKLKISAADSAGDTITSIINASQAAARIYTIPDAGADASFVMSAGAQSIAGIKTFTDGIVCEDGEFKLGAGAGTAVTATALEINTYCDISESGQTITGAGAQVVTAGKRSVLLNNAAATIAATIATTLAHPGYFVVKAGLEPAGGQDHTCTITTGTWDGTNKIATFADINDALIVYFDHAGNGTIISNSGAVVLS